MPRWSTSPTTCRRTTCSTARCSSAAAARYFPAGTIFLAVVDPGVGSARRGIAAEAGDYRFVAPGQRRADRGAARMGAEEDRRADRAALRAADRQPHVRGARPVRAGGRLAGEGDPADGARAARRPTITGSTFRSPSVERRVDHRRRAADRPVRQRRHQHRPADLRSRWRSGDDGSRRRASSRSDGWWRPTRTSSRERSARCSAAPIISSWPPTRRAPPIACSWRAASRAVRQSVVGGRQRSASGR